MKYRIYGQFTGNTGDKNESILWPFISIRAICVSLAWQTTRIINTKPWWKWCCATRIPSRGSVCSAIAFRRQSRPWRPAWPAKAWRSLLTRGWSKQHVSVPLVRLPCGWKNGGARGFHPVKPDLHHQIRCLSDHTTPFLLNRQNPEHRLKKQSVLRVYLAAAGVEISWFLLPCGKSASEAQTGSDRVSVQARVLKTAMRIWIILTK